MGRGINVQKGKLVSHKIEAHTRVIKAIKTENASDGLARNGSFEAGSQVFANDIPSRL